MARILNIGAENAPDTALSIRFAFKLKNEIKAFTLAVRNRRFYSTHSFETNGHSMLNLSRNLLASFIGLSILAACGVSDNATPNPRVATSNLITEIGEYYGALTETQRQTLSACDVDQKEFRRLMNLNYKSFDQDFVGGWRAVSAVEGCKSAATILLQVYLLRQKTVFEDNRSTLRWHTGQVLAGNGQTEDAIRYFEQTYKPDDEDQVEWNLYVGGTIAFLKRDKATLISLRDELAVQPVSESVKEARQRFLDDNPNITMPEGFIDNPQNLSVLDKLIRCFDQPYEKAYGPCERSD